nr:hypothetical protein [Acinetobacter gyllenbergii]
MVFLKFIKSFNTINTYLVVSVFFLIALLIYFYQINPT